MLCGYNYNERELGKFGRTIGSLEEVVILLFKTLETRKSNLELNKSMGAL